MTRTVQGQPAKPLVTARRSVPRLIKRQRSGLGQLLESSSLSSSMSDSTFASSYESTSSLQSSKSQPVQPPRSLFTAAAADAAREEKRIDLFDLTNAPKQVEFKNCHNCNALYAFSDCPQSSEEEEASHIGRVRAIRSAFCSGECCLTYLSLSNRE